MPLSLSSSLSLYLQILFFALFWSHENPLLRAEAFSLQPALSYHLTQSSKAANPLRHPSRTENLLQNSADARTSFVFHWDSASCKRRIQGLVLFQSDDSDNENDQTSIPAGDSVGEVEYDLGPASSVFLGQSLVLLAAVIVAKLVGTPGFLGLGKGFTLGTSEAWKWGVLATLPMAALAAALDFIEDAVPALKKVTKATQRSVLNLLGSRFLPVTGLVTAIVLGIVAGVGEEWMFRGVVQTELWNRVFLDFGGPIPAVIASSLLFGLLHSVTPVYAALATLASLYFGFLYVWTDNLAVVMLCHALYDVGALYYAHWTVANDLSPEERRSLLVSPLSSSMIQHNKQR